MFGRLTWDSIQTHDPFLFMATIGMPIVVIALVIVLAYFKKWGYLWREWFTTVDHKKIGFMYIILGMMMMLRGFVDAIMMRAQQSIAEGANHGYLTADHFSQIFSAHGTIMIIFAAMPIFIGLMNIAVPLQIGARDVAFPALNSVSFWLTVSASLLVMVSLSIGDFSTAGWTGIAPYFEKQYSPGSGVDYWTWALQLSGVGTTLTGINFFVTIIKMRAPGLKLMRMPLFTWTALTTNALIVLSFPALTVALLLLTLDRYLGMNFFTNLLGGNVMLYNNIFWMWGHPEVYIVILPAFGIFSEVVATFSRKQIFGYHSLVYATAVIMILSFTVWLHHFFTMGNSVDVNIAFGIATMLIAIPTGVKVFDWLFTMYRGRINFSTPMYWLVAFLVMFVVGGMTGVLMAIPPIDYLVHNTVFLVAHFHNMLIPGALFGYFAGLIYWFPKIFGFKLDERWGKISFWGWAIGFPTAFFPLYVLGFMGMPRRMYHYDNPTWQPLLIVAAIGTAIIAGAFVAMAIQAYVSVKNRKKNADLTGDPWNGRTLEWSIPSPPPVYNFAVIPTVEGRDSFWTEKEKGTAYKRPEKYSDIHVPKNVPYGVWIGIAAFFFGFAMIWYMWWLAILGLIGAITTVIIAANNDENEYVISAEEVKKIEDAHYERLAAAGGKQHE
ncbi:MAG: cytochrome o ubiquinol oxidase subunit I [Spirochaetales bacterium]|nr:cytochrome o ubiquinol oxidase subunit I [Spirochaetales bacterium]